MYVGPAEKTGVIPPSDRKLLFGQLDPVIKVSSKLLDLLSPSLEAENKWIGAAFNDTVNLKKKHVVLLRVWLMMFFVDGVYRRCLL